MAEPRRLPKNSVHRALNTMGDRWCQMILQAAFSGAERYDAFHTQTGASHNTLSLRLKTMTTNGLLVKAPLREGMARQGYQLTPMARDLFNSAALAWTWALRWGMTGDVCPTGLVHKGCGRPMLPKLVCRHCHGEISLRECRYEPGPGAGVEDIEIQRLHRKRTPAPGAASPGGDSFYDLIGDRWTSMVVGAQYMGLRRFDDIQASLDIATNVLTDRLRILVAAGILERRLYQISPARYEYRLTSKGADLFPRAVSLMLWGDEWLGDPEGPPVSVFHIRCGQPLDAVLICGECEEPITSETVIIRTPDPRNDDGERRAPRGVPSTAAEG